jgi:Helix-turn-helix domain
MKVWTSDEVRALGVRTDVETAGSILGLSRTQAYEAIKRGDIPHFKVGRRIVVPVAPLLHKLGIDADAIGETEPPALRVVGDA